MRATMATTLLTAAVLLGALTTSAHAEPRTKVYLNGVPAPVFFNDGDSFRVVGGQHAGMKARLEGYNTLESYGPVHQWGDWTYKELYVLAKEATLFARKGVWRCTSDLETDTYGRSLWWCEDLATELVRLGYAHAMSISDKPARAGLLAAQREAIANRRGIWAHGVPDYILTSAHSVAEDTEGRGTYNRMVSSHDGSSIKWRHNDEYGECEEVCDRGYEGEHRIARVIARMKAEESLAPFIADYDEARLTALIRDFALNSPIEAHLVAPAHAAPMKAALEGYRAEHIIGRTTRPSCHYYVAFGPRRFGGNKAKCLKW